MPTEPELTVDGDTPAEPKAPAPAKRVAAAAKSAAAEMSPPPSSVGTEETSVAAVAPTPSAAPSIEPAALPSSPVAAADVVAMSFDAVAHAIALQKTFLDGLLDRVPLAVR
jgi:hypothetical protein